MEFEEEEPTRLGARARRSSEHPRPQSGTAKLPAPPRVPSEPPPSGSLPPSITTTTGALGTTGTTTSSSAGGAPSSAISLSRVREAQSLGSLGHVRLLAGAMLVWTVIGVPMIVLTPGTDTDKLLCTVCLVMVALGFGWLFVRTGDRRPVVMDDLFGLSLVTAVAGAGLALGAGICSPYTGLVALALTFYCAATPPPRARKVYGVVAASHLVMGVLAMRGVTSSSGLLDPLPRGPVSIGLNVLWVEALYASALGIGQLAYGESARMLDGLERAVSEAAQRDALFREVRADLDRAAQLGGPGQFTGQVLGRYKLAEVIGRGGMGEVYAAEAIDGGGEAAVKLLRRDALTDPDVVARFEREARVVTQLRSPHVVTVHEAFGREAAVPYIAMERLRGADLAAELRATPVMSTGKALALVREVALGLDAAHAMGIVHRDLKPSNLFHAEDERGKRRWKVLDFGVSKLMSGDDATLTMNQLIGTPQYMAPEQTTGDGEIDHRTDVHALAAIAYRALTGRMAFSKGDVGQVLLAVATEIPDDPRSHRDVHEDVSFVLRIGLAKRPKDRFDHATELADALADALEGKLDDALRTRARRLLAAEPWGSRIDRA